MKNKIFKFSVFAPTNPDLLFRFNKKSISHKLDEYFLHQKYLYKDKENKITKTKTNFSFLKEYVDEYFSKEEESDELNKIDQEELKSKYQLLSQSELINNLNYLHENKKNTTMILKICLELLSRESFELMRDDLAASVQLGETVNDEEITKLFRIFIENDFFWYTNIELRSNLKTKFNNFSNSTIKNLNHFSKIFHKILNGDNKIFEIENYNGTHLYQLLLILSYTQNKNKNIWTEYFKRLEEVFKDYRENFKIESERKEKNLQISFYVILQIFDELFRFYNYSKIYRKKSYDAWFEDELKSLIRNNFELLMTIKEFYIQESPDLRNYNIKKYFNLYYMLKNFECDLENFELMRKFKNLVMNKIQALIESSSINYSELNEYYFFSILTNDEANSNQDQIEFIENILSRNIPFNMIKDEENAELQIKNENEILKNIVRILPLTIYQKNSKLISEKFLNSIIDYLYLHQLKKICFDDLITFSILYELLAKHAVKPGILLNENSFRDKTSKLKKFIIKNFENYLLMSSMIDRIANAKFFLIIFREEFEENLDKGEVRNLNELIDKEISKLLYVEKNHNQILKYISKLEVEYRYGIYRCFYLSDNLNDIKKKNQIENLIRDIKICSA